MRKLITLFEENFKPCGISSILGLSKQFIINNGYTDCEIDTLIKEGSIEECSGGYKMSGSYKERYAGSSYKHVPEYAR